MRKFAWLGLVGLVGILCQPGVAAASFHVHISGFAFQPDELTVALGDTLTWHNHDGAQHTATDRRCPSAGGAGPCAFDTGGLSLGQSASFTNIAGALYEYECFIHGFTGLLLVDDPLKFPDLAVTDITVLRSTPTPFNYQATRSVRYTVTNVGDEGAFASRASLTYFVGAEQRFLDLRNMPILQPGDSRTFTVPWYDFALVGDFVVQAVADVDEDVTESEEDNVAQITESILLPPGVLPGKDLRHP